MASIRDHMFVCAAAESGSHGEVQDNLQGRTIPQIGENPWQTVYSQQNFKPDYRDEFTNEILPRALIQEAIREELDYLNQHV